MRRRVCLCYAWDRQTSARQKYQKDTSARFGSVRLANRFSGYARPHDANMSWYVGGNPRTLKKLESRAYFLFSQRSQKNVMIPWLSFENAFQGRKVKKIMCTTVEGADSSDIGFSTPDELDIQRIRYFTSVGEKTEPRKHSVEMRVVFDQRFMSKLATGISYCLFGKKVLGSPYGLELHKGLWHKDGEASRVRGVTAFGHGATRPCMSW